MKASYRSLVAAVLTSALALSCGKNIHFNFGTASDRRVAERTWEACGTGAEGCERAYVLVTDAAKHSPSEVLAEMDKALAAINRAGPRPDDMASYLWDLGLVYELEGDWVKASATFEKAAAQAGGNRMAADRDVKEAEFARRERVHQFVSGPDGAKWNGDFPLVCSDMTLTLTGMNVKLEIVKGKAVSGWDPSIGETFVGNLITVEGGCDLTITGSSFDITGVQFASVTGGKLTLKDSNIVYRGGLDATGAVIEAAKRPTLTMIGGSLTSDGKKSPIGIISGSIYEARFDIEGTKITGGNVRIPKSSLVKPLPPGTPVDPKF